MLPFRGVLCFIAFLCLCVPVSLRAQGAAAVIVSGNVLDPSGAAIPHAVLHFSNQAGERTATADERGHFSVSVPIATYSLRIDASGFRDFLREDVGVSAAHNAPLNFTLEIATNTVEVDVASDPSLSNEASANKSALVFKENQLDTFSDDPATMQQQLLALGGSDPSNPPQVYVDGFSNGTLPPKESIREIRVNQNPFSAVYDQFGQGRIEILTKPGANQFHGNIETVIGNKALNTGNPFVGAQPSYNQDFINGNLSGPIGKKSSFFLAVQRREQNTNAIINAVTDINAANQNVIFNQAVATPSLTQNYSLRLDRQFTAKDTFIGRYTFAEASLTNAGIGLLTLPSQGFSSTTRTQTLQLSNSHIFSPKIVFDSAVQYIRTRTRQDANSSAVAVNVQGAFNGGGNSAQSLHDNQDRIELQEYFSIAQGKHFVRTGVRYRQLRQANLSTAGYNGQFDFTSLAAYKAGTPSQYTITSGVPNVSLTTGDIGVFAEDEWKATSALTLNYGVRFESQTAVPDHFDFCPRVGFAYSWKRGAKAKDPFFVIRGGFGMFYTRFPSANILQSLRQNGVSQKTYIVANPAFSVGNVPSISTFSAVPPTVYGISSHEHSPTTYQGMISAEHSLGKYGNVTAQYYQRRTIHQFESLNLNAPLPGTYNPSNPASGVRPLGGTQNVYSFATDGISNGHTLGMGLNLNAGERFNMFLFASVGSQESDTGFNGGGFVSNSYNVRDDAGRVAGYPPRQLYTGINAEPFKDFRINVFVAAQSSRAFNITIGRDINGDTQYNDRPAFATDLTRASVVRTAYGNFDTSPLPGQTIIPSNYGTGPATFYSELNLSKTFHFGPRPAPPVAPASAAKPATPPAAATPPATGTKAAPPPPLPPQRYRIQLSTEIDNPFNFVNRGQPIGVLSSPFFGQSVSLNQNFTGNTSANRIITFRTGFYF